MKSVVSYSGILIKKSIHIKTPKMLLKNPANVKRIDGDLERIE